MSKKSKKANNKAHDKAKVRAAVGAAILAKRAVNKKRARRKAKARLAAGTTALIVKKVAQKKSLERRGVEAEPVQATATVPYEAERQAIIDCALEMRGYGLIKGSGGNVSMRMPGACPDDSDAFLVTPTAMSYDTMLPSDVVLVDGCGTTLDGGRRPTSDMAAVLYIFRNMPQVNVVIHTHQPYATALGLVTDELPADFTTVIDELHAAVPVAPFTRSSDEGMGVLTVEHIGNALAVILKHHGVITVGRNIDQALTAAVYLEESCQAYLAALATGLPIAHLTPEQIAEESEERGYYGQPEE